MASEPSSADRDTINPYAASHIPGSPEMPLAPAAIVPRTYRLQMAWADRHRFLRSVGLLRVGAVAGATIGFYGLHGLLNDTFYSWRSGGLLASEPLMAARWIFVLVKAALGFYACWLQWTLADALAATAGGKTGRMEQWSIVQLRLAWLAIIVLAVNAIALARDWFELLLITDGQFPF